MVKKQQMQWSLKGAHRMLQVRAAVLNGDLSKRLAWRPPEADASPSPRLDVRAHPAIAESRMNPVNFTVPSILRPNPQLFPAALLIQIVALYQRHVALGKAPSPPSHRAQCGSSLSPSNADASRDLVAWRVGSVDFKDCRRKKLSILDVGSGSCLSSFIRKADATFPASVIG